MTVIKPTVPLSDAKDWAAKWQSENPNKAKAFFIPMEDIVEAMKEMAVLQDDGSGGFSLSLSADQGIRAYMAIDENTPASVGSNEKLLIVGTVKDANGDHCDIIEGGTYPTSGGITRVGSGIFDFTNPCPNYCDPNSPLFNPSSK